jgi:hypothetical protein
MKKFEVMVEIKIAKTFKVMADDEADAEQKITERIENAYEKLGDKYYSTSTDELTVDVGDVTEAE